MTALIDPSLFYVLYALLMLPVQGQLEPTDQAGDPALDQQPATGPRRRQPRRRQLRQQEQQQESGDDVMQMYEVEEPAAESSRLQLASSPMFYSPTGGFRTRSEFAARAVTSPGNHVRGYWHGEEQQQQQHITDVCAAQPWRTRLIPQHVGQPAMLLQPQDQAGQQQRQYGQPLHVQTTEEPASDQTLALLQQLREYVGPAGLSLLNSLEQQVGNRVGFQQQQQQQLLWQAAAAYQQPTLQLSANPFGFLEPHIGSLPATAAALGYRRDMGGHAQMVLAMGDYLVSRLSGQQPGVQQGMGTAHGVAGAGQQAGTAQAGSAVEAEAAAAAGAAAGGSAAVQAAPVSEMNHFGSFSQYCSWYNGVPPGYSQTRLELENARDFSWRKGCDKRRWSDYRMLWGAVASKAQQLTAQGSTADITSYAQAAAALDYEHKMKPCSYFTQYLKRRGKAAIESSSSGQPAGGHSASKRGAQQPPGDAGDEGEQQQQHQRKGRGGNAGKQGKRK
jgi:hypothetical protein